MSDVTKVELNNQIVLMRPAVKRARLHTISRLVQTVRKLSTSRIEKDNDGNTEKKSTIGDKHARKKEKILREIKVMKKLSVDEISKFALINDKPFSQSLRGATVSENERALSRLADQKFVKAKVTTFRKMFPSWKVQVPSVYSMWAFKKKFSRILAEGINSPNFAEIKQLKPAAKRFGRPEQSPITVGQNIVLKSDASKRQRRKKKTKKKITKNNVTSGNSDLAVGLKTIANENVGHDIANRLDSLMDIVKKPDNELPLALTSPKSSISKPKSIVAKQQKVISPAATQISKLDEVKICKTGLIQTKSVSRPKAQMHGWDPNLVPVHRMISNEMVVKRLDLSVIGDDEFFVGRDTVKGDEDRLVSAHRVKPSSFFIDSDGEAGPDSDEDVNRKSDNFRDDFADATSSSACISRSSWADRRYDSNATRPRNRFERRANIREFGMKQSGSKATHSLKKSTRFTATASDRIIPDVAKSIVEEKLHPSWEAKRKMTEQSKNIVAFQGKKITFGDDE